MSATANRYQSRSQPKCRCSAVSPGGSTSVRKPNVLAGVGNRVQLGQHLDGGVLQFALFGRGRVGEPVAAEGVGHDVRRHHCPRRGPSGRTDCPARSPVGSIQRTCGTGTSVSSETSRNTSILVVHPVGGEHRDVGRGRRDPGHPLPLDRCTVLGPAAGQDDGLRGHAVGVDTAFDFHLGFDWGGHDGGQPLRQGGGKVTGVTTRALQSVNVGLDARLVGHIVLRSLRYAPAAIRNPRTDPAPGRGSGRQKSRR